MTDRAEPMAEEDLAALITECIEASIRLDVKVVGAAMDRLFNEGTPEDGIRFIMGCLVMQAGMMTSEEAARVIMSGARKAQHPGEVLYVRMLADVITGNNDLAMERWIDSLCDETSGPSGAPGWALGTALQRAASLVGRTRARFN